MTYPSNLSADCAETKEVIAMFYLWIVCGSNGKGFLLPEQENWSGHLLIEPQISGVAEKLYLPVEKNDSVWNVQLPAGFSWVTGSGRSRELSHCCRLAMQKGALQFIIYAAQCSRQDTMFQKFSLPPNQPVSIGSREDNQIQYAEVAVSRRHATILSREDGSAVFSDQSSHGSFVCGTFCKNESRVLHYGDRIDILPTLQILYLGDFLAVNNAQKVRIDPALTPYAPPSAEAAGDEPAVTVEFHRAPRHVQQPNAEVIELEAPLEKERNQELPTWLTIGPSITMVLPMVVSSVVAQRSMATSLAMIGTSSALAVMWGSFNRKYQDKQRRLAEENRRRICRQYYAEMEEKLTAETERERSRLRYNYLNVEECAAIPDSKVTRLWERMPSHEDFLSVRLGLGERLLPSTLSMQRLKMSLVDDPLRHEPQRLYDQYHTMHDVPVLLNLREHQTIGVLGNKMSPWLMQSLVVQAAASHSYHDVRIAVLHDDVDREQWNFAKWLPHAYAEDDRSLRMVVCEENAVQEVAQHIDGVLSMRADMLKERADSHGDGLEDTLQIPWYLIFCTDPRLLENCSLVRYLTVHGLGFTILLQTMSMELLPKECDMVIDAREQLGALYSMDGEMTGVQFELVNAEQLRRFSEKIAGMRIKEVVENSAIPSLVTFLETYHVRSVEEMDVRSFWNENHAWKGIKAYLGLKAGSVPFFLDISDKNHGPHGLIAGTTGAGKSVLLQSFILSLAINYSPTEVQFILIDYKGGGTSEDFRDLPHAAGVIDSLQGERMIFRALASIKGEILRRENLFKSHGVNSIDDYMQLYNADPEQEPLGHLIIIVDEFAELKKEQPEFMHELVSAARVGRSLGMHLVLATQKPSNSVSDEIEANTRFRICLRVASKSDSNEMLKRPEAAYLKGMGRCYVQVGNDELFEQVQTSFPGAVYAPNALRHEEEPRMLNEAGRPIKVRKRKSADAEAKAARQKTELDAVLEYISTVCSQYRFKPAKKMWLPELSTSLRLEELDEVRRLQYEKGLWPAAADSDLAVCYGMADDVDKQRYVPAVMNFTSEKNQMIIGLAGMGKTTMLQTLAVALALRYSPQEVNLYIFSLTSHTLASLGTLPHVGDIVYEEDEDEQIRLIEMIYRESERRKKLFTSMATDNYTQYNRALRQADRAAETVPAIVVMIDRMEQIRSWADNRKEDKLQLFYDLLRSGTSQGIYFILTAFARNELPAKYDAFVHGVCLQMSDRMDYADALGARIPGEWNGIQEAPGRGVIAQVNKEAKETYIYEMQVAHYGSNESDAKRSELISRLGEEMRQAWTGALPTRIARIPEKPGLSDLLGDSRMQTALKTVGQLPLYYDKRSGEAKAVDLREFFSFLVVGPRKSGKTNLLMNIADTFARKDAQIYVIASGEMNSWAAKSGYTAFEPGAEEWIAEFVSIFRRVAARDQELVQARRTGGMEARNKMLSAFAPIVLLIDDVEKYIDKYAATPDVINKLNLFLAENMGGHGIYTVASLSYSAYTSARMKEPVATMTRARRGVMLQPRLNECDPFGVSLPYSQKNLAYGLGEGLLVTDQGATQIVCPQYDANQRT